LRVIAGEAKGRRLQSLPGLDVRPSSDRLKEALFSILGPNIPGALVLDLYAGSGALGIEALSRGATGVTFVEVDRRAVAMIERNLASTGLAEGATIENSTAEAFACGRSAKPFDIVLIDPPYQVGLPSDVLVCLAEGGFINPDSTIVVEGSRRKLPAEAPVGFISTSQKRYADSVLCFLQMERGH